MADNPDIAEEWAQRIQCAVEGVAFESSNHFTINRLFRDATQEKGINPSKPFLWARSRCIELGSSETYIGEITY